MNVERGDRGVNVLPAERDSRLRAGALVDQHVACLGDFSRSLLRECVQSLFQGRINSRLKRDLLIKVD